MTADSHLCLCHIKHRLHFVKSLILVRFSFRNSNVNLMCIVKDRCLVVKSRVRQDGYYATQILTVVSHTSTSLSRLKDIKDADEMHFFVGCSNLPGMLLPCV